MSENFTGGDKHLWCCPACPFEAAGPDGLAAHLRHVHMPPSPEEEKAKNLWTCPWSQCPRSRRTLHGPFFLALHLDAHAINADAWKKAMNARKRGPVSKLIATRSREWFLAFDWTKTNRALAPIIGLGHRQVEELRRRLRREGYPMPTRATMLWSVAKRFLHDHPREELLALDWTKTNAVLASLLGVSYSQVSELRNLLRAEGHSIPVAQRGMPPRWRGSIEAYLDAGLGKYSDREVARKLGVPYWQVHRMRRRLEIPLAARALQTKLASLKPAQNGDPKPVHPRQKEGATAKRSRKTCPVCRRRPLPKKGLSPSTGKMRYRALCDVCARRRRRAAGLSDPPPPLCPSCGTRPRSRKGFRHGYPRYEPLCWPCSRGKR